MFKWAVRCLERWLLTLRYRSQMESLCAGLQRLQLARQMMEGGSIPTTAHSARHSSPEEAERRVHALRSSFPQDAASRQVVEEFVEFYEHNVLLFARLQLPLLQSHLHRIEQLGQAAADVEERLLSLHSEDARADRGASRSASSQRPRGNTTNL